MNSQTGVEFLLEVSATPCMRRIERNLGGVSGWAHMKEWSFGDL